MAEISPELFRKLQVIPHGLKRKAYTTLVEELVELIVDVLEKDGRFEVRTVNNGFDAGMMVKEYHPDLIVLDVMLPDINGKEV